LIILILISPLLFAVAPPLISTLFPYTTLFRSRFLVLVEAKGIKPVIFISKMDMADKGLHDRLVGYKRTYEKIGYSVELFSIKDKQGLSRLKMYFADHVSDIAGQSG